MQRWGWCQGSFRQIATDRERIRQLSTRMLSLIIKVNTFKVSFGKVLIRKAVVNFYFLLFKNFFTFSLLITKNIKLIAYFFP
jgi:hypothetical protein